jgi:predicted dienelactone hydrolase
MLTFSKLRWLNLLAIVTLTTIAIPRPGNAADRVTLHYPPFKDFSISVGDLDKFAKTGKIAPEFAQYVKQATPAQIQQLRQSLQQRYDISPRYITQFVNSPLVKPLLERLGEILQGDKLTNGKQPIATALIRAAADKQQGLTAINFLQRFPSRQLTVNLNGGFAIYASFTELLKQREATLSSLAQIANAEALTSKTDVANKLDLRQAGSLRWQKRRFDWLDRARQRNVPGDLYLPQTTTNDPIRLIVISHGVAEDRTAFAYLAEHLASYGFAVAAIEHVGGDANRFRKYFSGLAPAPAATELLQRPRDISFLLDELQRQALADPILARINLQQVGAIGHSLGGYTTLALAGAEIDFDRITQYCNPNRSLNLSVVLQCRAKELPAKRYTLQDPRIKAIFAINPLGNTIFGRRGISKVNVPVFLMGGSDDVVTPVVPEQIYPFTWLQTPDKYLAILNKGTHFSAPAVNQNDAVFPVNDSLIGPDPKLARTYIKALNVAFFQTYLANRSEFRNYLNAAYANKLTLTNPPFQQQVTQLNATTNSNRASLSLNLIQSSASDRIAEILDLASTQTARVTP